MQNKKQKSEVPIQIHDIMTISCTDLGILKNKKK